MMKRKFIISIILFFFIFKATGQNVTITGTIKDSVTGEGLPYASIIFKNTTIGTASDKNGYFSFSAPVGKKTLEISYLGYDTQKIGINPEKTKQLNISLVPSGISINEVVIKPTKEKYSKKDNPAVKFVKNIIARKKDNNPYSHDYYSYDHYEKMIFAMNEYTPKPKKNGTKGKFDFLTEFVDTLETGTTILPISEKEKIETIFYRRNPKSEKHIVKGSKSSGVDEVFSRDGVQQFLEEVFREVDIFQNNIPLFLQRFVSPLSGIGPSYYKYYLLDTIKIDNKACVDLGFVPFNSETFGFTGHLYVTLDSTYQVKKAVLNVPHDINLNFVSKMTIEQDFKYTNDSTRIITKDNITVNFKLSEKSKGMYAQRLSIYSNHSFNTPSSEDLLVFNEKAPVIMQKDAYNKPDSYWDESRPEEAKRKNNNSVNNLMKKLRSVPVFYYTEKFISMIVSGYIPTNKDPLKNKFDLGPMNSTFNGNAIEGARFRIGGGTTPVFNKRLFTEGYAAYGTKDKKLKYDALIEYSFNDRKTYRLEYPIHSLRIEHMYDLNKLGQQYMYTSKDNMMLAIRRQKDTRATYLRKTEVTYTREHYNGISYGAVIRNLREYSTDYAEFNRFNADGTITPEKSYNMTALELRFRYGKNEKFYQTRTQRIPITYDALIFNINHIMAKRGFLGSSYNYQRTDIGLQKRFWFSAFGYVDFIAKAGKVWNKVPYPLLILPNANLTYTIQPEAYTNMNALEFLNDQYASWDLTYYLNGNLLNRIPYIKKLKWREVFTFRGLWGNLTDKNNPMLADNKDGLYIFPNGSFTMDKYPYMEAGVGIENIFKFLRIDYVWRLNYRNNPNIQKSGIRMTMKLSF